MLADILYVVEEAALLIGAFSFVLEFWIFISIYLQRLHSVELKVTLEENISSL